MPCWQQQKKVIETAINQAFSICQVLCIDEYICTETHFILTLSLKICFSIEGQVTGFNSFPKVIGLLSHMARIQI